MQYGSPQKRKFARRLLPDSFYFISKFIDEIKSFLNVLLRIPGIPMPLSKGLVEYLELFHG